MNAIEVIVAIAGALGMKELLQAGFKRYTSNHDAAVEGRRKNKEEVTAIEATTNAEMLDKLLKQMDQRIQGYEKSITDMASRHESDMREQKETTHRLERKVEDLQTALRDWQLGNRVPRGQVLIPINDVKRVRELAAGILPASWYPGEDQEIEPGGLALA